MLAVVFLLLFFMSYSEDMVAALLEATGRDNVAMWAVGLVLSWTVPRSSWRPDSSGGFRRRRTALPTLVVVVDFVRSGAVPRPVVGASAGGTSAVD